MRRSVSILSDISRIAFASAIFCCFFAFFALITELENAGLSLLWPVMAFLLVYAAGRIASSREIVLLKYAGIEIAAIAAGLFIILMFADVPNDALRFRLLISLCFVIDAGVCAKAALSENRLENIVHRFDVCILLFVVMLLAEHYLDIRSVSTALMTIFTAFVLLLITVVFMRTEKNGISGNKAGRLIPVIIFAVIIGAALIIGMYGQTGAGSVVDALTTAVKAVFGAVAAAASFVWRQWMRFCNWLATFFEERETVPVENTQNAHVPDNPEPAELSQASVIVAYALTAIVIIAIIVAVIMALRRAKTKKRWILKSENRAAVRSGSFWQSVKDVLRRIKQHVEYRIKCLRYRNTPAGLLIWCESKVHGRFRRMKGESGPGFLRRLSESCSGEDKNALLELAMLVEKNFYSLSAPSVSSALCRAVRSCRFPQ